MERGRTRIVFWATGAVAEEVETSPFEAGMPIGARVVVAVTAAAMTDAGTFDCVLTSASGCVINTTPATLVVQTLNLVQQPADRAACLNAPLSLCLALDAASQTPNVVYQWRRNGVNVANRNGNSVCWSPVSNQAQSGDAGVYDCVISTAGCSTVSGTARVTVIDARPTYNLQPLGGVICAGESKTFTAAAGLYIGEADFKWYKVGVSGPIGSGSTLTVSNAKESDSGVYYCQVRNACHSLDSNAVTLTVRGAVALTGQPSPATACVGGRANFSVVATGTTDFQWQADSGNGFVDVNDGGSYSGATGPTLTVTGVPGALNGTRYRCVLTTGCGSLQSKEARLTVPGVAIAADSAVCFGTTGLRATGPVGATAYRWSISNGFITSSNNQWELVYTPSSAGTVTLTLEATFPGGCVRTVTKSVAVNDCRPAVSAEPATGVGAQTATLAGTVNPNGSETSAAFLYGTTPGGPYPFASQAGPVPMDGTTTRPVSAALTGLTTGVTYYYVVEAVNQYGRSRSTERSFRTALCGVTLSASGASFPASGGTGRLTVTAGGDCGWTVTGVPDWIQNLTPTGATGPGTVTFTIVANRTETGRSATLEINGQAYTITQAASVPVNGSVGFRVLSTTIAPSSCGGAYANDYVMTATLSNTGNQAIFNPYVQALELGEAAGSPLPAVPFRLITADGAGCTQGGLVGDRQTTDGAFPRWSFRPSRRASR